MKLFYCVVLMVLFLAACAPDKSSFPQEDFETAIDYEVADDVVIWYTDSAELKAKITGKTLRRFIDRIKPFDEFSNGVVVDFFDKNGEPESQMLSDYAIRYDKDELIVARDSNGVILSNEKGDSLISSELVWDSGEDRIYTHRFVKIITPTRIIWGQGFESNSDFSKGRIQSVEGELEVNNIVEEEK